jgi:hypothetical protein
MALCTENGMGFYARNLEDTQFWGDGTYRTAVAVDSENAFYGEVNTDYPKKQAANFSKINFKSEFMGKPVTSISWKFSRTGSVTAAAAAATAAARPTAPKPAPAPVATPAPAAVATPKLVSRTKGNPKDFYYALDSNGTGVYIYGTKRKIKDIVIPGELEGFPVTQVIGLHCDPGDQTYWKEFKQDKWTHCFYDPVISSVTFPQPLPLLGAGLFGHLGITEIDLPGDLKYIPDEFFDHCLYLRRVRMPRKITSIGNRAFWFNKSLEQITLPEGLEHIGEKAFENCFKLREISFPESLQSIGVRAFTDCVNLASIKFPSHPISYIPSGGTRSVTRRAELTGITWQESVGVVGNNRAFAGCTKLSTCGLVQMKAIMDSGYREGFR